MRKIKIAQIGMNTNSHAPHVFRSLKKQNDIFDFVGYALPENERVRIPHKVAEIESLAPELTLEEILKDPEIEAVTIETDEIFLTKYALLAAQHGKHIHMEKPGGADLQEFERLIGMMRESGKVFHIGYMYRYNPFVQELLHKVKSGELGDIISVEAQMNCTHPVPVRTWLKDLPGGMMFFLGCHLIDLILQIKGIPEKVIPLNKCTGVDGVVSEDFGMAVLEYKDGVSFAKTVAWELGGFNRRQLVVSGTKGTVELKPFEVCVGGQQYTEKVEVHDTGWFAAGEKCKSDLHDRYDPMLAAFAEMVAGVKENPYTLDYELELYKTILKCCGVK